MEEERALAEPFHNSLGIATMGNNGTNQVENEHNLAPRATTATPPYSSSVDSAGGASRQGHPFASDFIGISGTSASRSTGPTTSANEPQEDDVPFLCPACDCMVVTGERFSLK